MRWLLLGVTTTTTDAELYSSARGPSPTWVYDKWCIPEIQRRSGNCRTHFLEAEALNELLSRFPESLGQKV